MKLVRTKQREGLIRARAFGADHSTGDVVIFLDSHCETNVGWLPPLLARIQDNYRNVVCPTIEVIDHLTFSYRGVDPLIRGTFNWRFDYKERGITDEQRRRRKDETEPVKCVSNFVVIFFNIHHSPIACTFFKYPHSAQLYQPFGRLLVDS